MMLKLHITIHENAFHENARTTTEFTPGAIPSSHAFCLCILMTQCMGDMLHFMYTGFTFELFVYNYQAYIPPTWQFWDSGGVKLESLCNFSIMGCQWTVNCLLGHA